VELRRYNQIIQKKATAPTEPSKTQDSYNVYSLLDDNIVGSSPNHCSDTLEGEWAKYCSGIDRPDMRTCDILHWWQVCISFMSHPRSLIRFHIN